MNKRYFIKSIFAGALLCGLQSPSVALADDGNNIVVVKIFSFSCPVCKASETQDSFIEQSVKLKGGKFVRAPLPSMENDMGDKDKYYYASRRMGDNIAVKVHQSLYKASQELNISMPDMTSVYVWLQQDLGDELGPKNLNALAQYAQDNITNAAYTRAVNLAKAAGVDAIPAYIILKNNQLVTTIDAEMYPQGLSSLREAVISKVGSLSNSKESSNTK